MTLSSLRSKSTLFLVLTGLGLVVPSAFAQTLTVVSGQGQLLTPLQQSQALVVKLLDASGNPIPGAPITFALTDSLGLYQSANVQSGVTDSTGTAFTYIYGAGLIPGQSTTYDALTVTANYLGTAFATFYETTSGVTSTGTPLVTANFSQLNSFQTLTGPAGSTATVPLQVQVVSNSGGVPNVALSLVLDPSSTGTISCAEGPAPLSNAVGIATCTPVFGKVGSGTLTVSIGGYNSQIPISFNVTVGPPALIQITSGNNQSGTPGKQLPLPIVVVVTDLGGNPTPGINLNFTSVTPGGATFNGIRNPTDASGKASANVVLGSVPGNIQISVTDSGGLIKNPAILTETVNVTLTGITKSSGDLQTAFVNASFSAPLVVNVSSSQGAIAGTPVSFAVTSGSATVATPNATTDGNGNASTTVTAGATAGPVVVTASTSGFSVSFNLTVVPPGPANLTFTNGASGAANSMSPGSIVTIYGTGIASNIQGVTSAFGVGPLPLQMAGVTVQVGQAYAPIIDIGNVSGSQFVSIEIPREATPGATTLTIAIPGGGSTTVPVTINQASPGLFTYSGANNQQYLVAIKSNGTVASPSNPATRGETVTMYLTGLPLTPGIATNAFPAPGSTASSQYSLILGVANQGAPFTAVAYSPDLQGVETMSFTVPTTVTPGPVQISIGVQGTSQTFFSQGAILNVQ